MFGAAFYCAYKMKIVSSNIATADYDRQKRELKIVFIKRPLWEYTYLKVPPNIWVEFVRVESKGRYLKDIIEPRYMYIRRIIRNNKKS